MRASTLNRQIIVEKPVQTQDPVYGAPVTSWEPLVPLAGSPVTGEPFWAEVQDALPSRSESIRQGLVQGRNQTRIRIRWRDDIDSSMRIVIVDDGRILQIVGGPAEIGGRKRMLEMMCERFTSPGASG